VRSPFFPVEGRVPPPNPSEDEERGIRERIKVKVVGRPPAGRPTEGRGGFPWEGQPRRVAGQALLALYPYIPIVSVLPSRLFQRA
jgi:hypothetical protein